MNLALVIAALASSKSATAASTSVGVAGLAAFLGADVWPWIVGAAGATVVHVRNPPTTRGMAVGNGIISVFLGGVGGPWTGEMLSYYVGPHFGGPMTVLMASGVLSALWPAYAPLAWDRVRKILKAK